AGCEKKPPEEVTLKVAAIETAYGAQMWKDVAAAFTAETGIKVEVVTDKFIEDIIGPQMKSGSYPDVVHLSIGRAQALTETLVKDNAVLDLTNALSATIPGETKAAKDKISAGFTDSSITNPYADGKTYLAPMFYSPCGLFYDANLLKTNGWEVPKTWDEMWTLGDAAKAKGIALFAYPHAGYFDAFFYSLCVGVGGQEFLNKVTSYTEGTWDTAEGAKVIEIIAKLATYTAKSVPANASDENFKNNQQLILDDKAIFCPNGTWLPGEMKDAPRAPGFEWGMCALPAVTATGKATSYTFFEQAWIPKEAAHKTEAEKFVSFLYSDKAVEIFANEKNGGGAIQPVKGVAEKLSAANKVFYSIYENGAVAVMDAFKTTDPVEGITPRAFAFNPVDSLVAGTKTAADYKADLVKLFDNLRPALKK
ncbi:MAG: carbohydrate ABC transporter substrate-binding protein, partial [Clostridia bacterium]